jgi:hypothetical protein
MVNIGSVMRVAAAFERMRSRAASAVAMSRAWMWKVHEQ